MAEGNNPYNVPVRMSQTNVLVSEFDSMCEKFGKEMTAIQEEMNRFQVDMFNRAVASAHGITSPLIQEADNGEQKLRLRFDLSQYLPEDIEVKIENNHLMVHAKHEENEGTKRVYREYNQQFLIPQGVLADSVQSNLSADGVLTVEAPISQLPDAQKPLGIKR